MEFFPHPTTETFAAIKLYTNTPQWQGVPFYLEAGKELEKKSTEIRQIFKPVSSCLWSESGGVCSPDRINDTYNA